MKWMIVAVMAVAGVGAGRTTRPSTGPALLDTKVVTAKLADADDAVAKAKDQARQRWEASADYAALKKDLEDKRVARDNAKAGTDLQAKLDTAKAYNDARRAFEAADAKGVDGDREVADSVRAHEAAARELADVERENGKRKAEADARDPIKGAMKEGKIVVGMTMDQVKLVFKVDGRIVSQNEDATIYEFYPHAISELGEGYIAKFTVWFDRNNRVTRFDR